MKNLFGKLLNGHKRQYAAVMVMSSARDVMQILHYKKDTTMICHIGIARAVEKC